MTALYIILGIIAFFVLVLSIRITINAEFFDEFKLDIKWMFLKIQILPAKKKDKPKKAPKKTDWGLVLTFVVGIVGALIMGFGMSKIMVGSPEKMDMIIGMITGVVGLLICVLNYPIYSYLKSNKN